MIDWYGVAVSALWIFGLAELLATLSHAYWSSGSKQKSFRQVLSAPPFRLSIAAGLVLFALGALLSVDTWWERIGWAGVVILAAWEGRAAWRALHAQTKGG